MRAQISQNPALAKLSLPMLEAIGGPLIIYNNTGLTSLSSLEHLAVVNATGKSAPAIPIPGLSVRLRFAFFPLRATALPVAIPHPRPVRARLCTRFCPQCGTTAPLWLAALPASAAKHCVKD